MTKNPFSSNDTEIKDPNFKDLIDTKQALKASRNESFLEKNAGLIFAVGIIAFGFLMFGAAEVGLTSVAGKGLALAAGSCGLIGSSGLIKKGFNYFSNANKSNDKAVKSIDEAIAEVAKSIGQNAQAKAQSQGIVNALDELNNKFDTGNLSGEEMKALNGIAEKLWSSREIESRRRTGGYRDRGDQYYSPSEDGGGFRGGGGARGLGGGGGRGPSGD